MCSVAVPPVCPSLTRPSDVLRQPVPETCRLPPDGTEYDAEETTTCSPEPPPPPQQLPPTQQQPQPPPPPQPLHHMTQNNRTCQPHSPPASYSPAPPDEPQDGPDSPQDALLGPEEGADDGMEMDGSPRCPGRTGADERVVGKPGTRCDECCEHRPRTDAPGLICVLWSRMTSTPPLREGTVKRARGRPVL